MSHHHTDSPDHEADSSHDHHPDHERPRPQRLLQQTTATGRRLFFDAFSGISGDMTVSALLDLGVPVTVVQDSLRCLPIHGYQLRCGVRKRNGIASASFDVLVEKPQPERTWSGIDQMLEEAPLQASVKVLSRKIFRALAEAEAHVHGSCVDSVHFHEVGAVDAIVDIVGVAAMLSWLQPAEIWCSPLPIGRGLIQCQHGVLPLPAPAALQLLLGIPTYGVDLEGELVTPTGAAIIRTVVHRFAHWPPIIAEHIGFGSGAKEFPGRPNLLRAVLGMPSEVDPCHEVPASHVVVETNVDDMTGELAGHVIHLLLAAGAVDAWTTATTTKKGRPGLMVSALVERSALSSVQDLMLRETTSIGVRTHAVGRLTRPRRMVEVTTPFGMIPLKVSGGPYGPDQVKPEFDSCVKAAEAAGVPVREVIAASLYAWRAL